MIGLDAQWREYTKLSKPEVIALQRVYAGTADAYQQRLALRTITNKLCRTHDVLFIPGKPDETAFLSGRAFVGMQILRHLRIAVGKMTDEEPNE